MRWFALAYALTALLRCGSSPEAKQPGTTAATAGGTTAPADPADLAEPAAPAELAPPAAAEPAEPARPPADAQLGDQAAGFLAAHNRVRAEHCAPPLAWSAELARVAQGWADQLRAKGCVFGHSSSRFGENLAAGTRGALDPERVVAMWYDEVEQYDFARPGFSMTTGHFTQVVWTATTQVGCGHTTCKGNDIYVCNYDPAGNVQGEYKTRVKPTGCRR